MNISELLTNLNQQGVLLWAENDRLRIHSPKGVLTPELKADLTARKNEILRFIHNTGSQSRLQASRNWIICPQPNSQAKLRLFCFSYAGGGASVFRTWPENLANVEVCLVQLPGRENRIGEQPFCEVLPLVQKLTEVLLPYLNKPFAFYGHSMGALVSFELARQLIKQHALSPVYLFVAACAAPHLSDSSFNRQFGKLKNLLALKWDFLSYLTMVRWLNPWISNQVWFDFVFNETRSPVFIKKIMDCYGLEISESVWKQPELKQMLLPLLKADLLAVANYKYRADEPLNCPISVFGGLQDRVCDRRDNLLAWGNHTRHSFQLTMFPGGHFFLNEKALPSLLDSISQKLAEVLIK